MPIFSRVYSHGEAVVISHTEGLLVLAFRNAPASMADELKRMFPLSSELMLNLAGQQVVELRPTSETRAGTFTLTLRIEYRKQKK